MICISKDGDKYVSEDASDESYIGTDATLDGAVDTVKHYLQGEYGGSGEVEMPDGTIVTVTAP